MSKCQQYDSMMSVLRLALIISCVRVARRCLDHWPRLGCVDGLRLLNLQHNRITRIQQGSHLQRLVFLDLYHNHISDMAGLDGLRSLRVLMLGQNRSVACDRTH